MNEVAQGLTVGQVWYLIIAGTFVVSIGVYLIFKMFGKFRDDTEYNNGYAAGRLRGVKDSIDLERLVKALDELKDITPK